MSTTISSPVKIRKIWINENSQKDQVAIQFAQLVRGPSALSKLAQVAQDMQSLGSGLVTTVFSMKREVAERLFGTSNADYSNQDFDQWPEATALVEELGEKLAISVIENTVQNPAQPNQQPKINPATGETLTSGGKPIYRHTTLSTVSEVKYNWLAADKVGVLDKAPASKVNAIDSFGVNQ